MVFCKTIFCTHISKLNTKFITIRQVYKVNSCKYKNFNLKIRPLLLGSDT